MATCPTCDHLTAEGQRFCPSCGTSLGLDHLPTGTAPRPSSRPKTPPSPAPRFVPGALFAEGYRIVGLLGRGGMGGGHGVRGLAARAVWVQHGPALAEIRSRLKL